MLDKKDIAMRLFCLQNEEEFEFFSLSEEEKVKHLSKFVKHQSPTSPLKEMFNKLGNEVDFSPDPAMEAVKKKDMEEINSLKDRLFNLIEGK